MHYQGYPYGPRTTLAEMNNQATFNIMGAYAQSKLANVLFTQELPKRLSADPESDVLANVAHPGMVTTDLGRHMKGIFRAYLPVSCHAHSRIASDADSCHLPASLSSPPKTIHNLRSIS
jgi:NAD(P)-dependent dehydrogenase (short-subunit alcohol dehydrogenase family)